MKYFLKQEVIYVRKILSINKTSIKIDHPDLNNQIEIISRKVYILNK